MSETKTIESETPAAVAGAAPCSEFWDSWLEWLNAVKPAKAQEDMCFSAWRDGWLSRKGQHHLRHIPNDKLTGSGCVPPASEPK